MREQTLLARPERINIHALDPVYIVAKISFTPFMERINVWDVLRNTLTGEKGLGGLKQGECYERGCLIGLSKKRMNKPLCPIRLIFFIFLGDTYSLIYKATLMNVEN